MEKKLLNKKFLKKPNDKNKNGYFKIKRTFLEAEKWKYI